MFKTIFYKLKYKIILFTFSVMTQYVVGTYYLTRVGIIGWPVHVQKYALALIRF